MTLCSPKNVVNVPQSNCTLDSIFPALVSTDSCGYLNLSQTILCNSPTMPLLAYSQDLLLTTTWIIHSSERSCQSKYCAWIYVLKSSFQWPKAKYKETTVNPHCGPFPVFSIVVNFRKKKNLCSVLICKELRSRQTFPHNKNNWENGNSMTFPGPIRKLRSKGK